MSCYSFSRGSSRPRDWTCIFYNSCIGRWVLYPLSHRESPIRYLIGISILQRRQWHPTPVLLPGKSHGRRSLVGCSPGGHEELDMTERLYFHFSLLCIGEGNGNPLQCSCLENPRGGVAQCRTQLEWLSSSILALQISSLVLFFYISCIWVNIWYLFFWLTSLSTTGSSFIHLTRTGSDVFLFLTE